MEKLFVLAAGWVVAEIVLNYHKKRLRENFDNQVASWYGYQEKGYNTTPVVAVQTCGHNEGLLGAGRWCSCEPTTITEHSNHDKTTSTSLMVGSANPKTLIPPRFVPPITDVEEWGTDNYTLHSAINDYRSDDLYLSGYATASSDHQHPCYEIQGGNPERCTAPLLKEDFQILQNYGISKVPSRDDVPTRKRHPFTGDDQHLVYDPRMTGHSDPDRGYVDKLLGQPKFYYDDINAVRAPNYITRNKIDVFSFGESTGRLRDPKDYGLSGNVNQLAVDEFHDNAVMHRQDMMTSLMAKRNRELQQQKDFPISTNGQRMPGGTSKI
jgi:hypothetical protein